MAYCKHTYPEKCNDTIEQIKEGKTEIRIDKWYKHSSGFYWMLNRKNYFHIWKFEKRIETTCGIFKGMIHYRLSDNNTLIELGYQILDTKEEAMEFLKLFDAE